MSSLFETRKRCAQRWVTDLCDVQFSAPRGWTDAQRQARVLELTRLVIKALPLSLNEESIQALLAKARSQLLAEAETNAWPLPRTVLTAVSAAGQSFQRAQAASLAAQTGQRTAPLDPQTLRWMQQWVKRHRSAPPTKHWDSDAARQLIEGNLLTREEVYETRSISDPSLQPSADYQRWVQRQRTVRVYEMLGIPLSRLDDEMARDEDPRAIARAVGESRRITDQRRQDEQSEGE